MLTPKIYFYHSAIIFRVFNLKHVLPAHTHSIPLVQPQDPNFEESIKQLISPFVPNV